MTPPASQYRGFADLANAQVEGADFRITIRDVDGSSVAVVAPHGGSIESYTSDIARSAAGQDFNLYLFEGIKRAGNYSHLHLTSSRFDEPRCLAMVSTCDRVLTVHGFGGEHQQALVGGLDEHLKQSVADGLSALGIDVLTQGHQFAGLDPKNICNRGRSGIGVQVELSMGLRLHGPREAIALALRAALLA